MKKLLLLVPMVALLAAGCGSTVVSNQSDQSTVVATPTPSPTPSAAADTSMSSSWQGTLMASNDSAKGNYMLTTGGHTIYLHTSRDYSSLMGKMVNVAYTGDLTSFTVGNITAQ